MSFSTMAREQAQSMIKEEMKKQGANMGKEVMIKGVNKAAERLQNLKQAGTLGEMDPRLKEAIANLCSIAQRGGRRTRRMRKSAARKSRRARGISRKKSTKKKARTRRRKV